MYRDWTYVNMKDGRVLVVFSDNRINGVGTLNVFPVSELEHFDAEFLTTETVDASDVLKTYKM